MSEHTCNYIDTRLGITEADTSPKQTMRKRPVVIDVHVAWCVCVCVCVVNGHNREPYKNG